MKSSSNNNDTCSPTKERWLSRRLGRTAQSLKPQPGYLKSTAKLNVFIGPSVEGGDQEYIKVISGSVDDRMPSFA